MQDIQASQLVAKIEVELAKFCELLPDGSASPNAVDLRAAFRALVAHLALEPAPPTRACPSCKGIIMRAATRCVHCWAQSAPPDA